MLIELHVSDFAIIDRLALSLAPGFNVLTGETGAGKSIIIDAVSALLGSRLGPETVRAGAELARVEGIFDLPPTLELADVLGADEPAAGDNTLILSRELHRGGRSICRVNGRIVPVSVLQAAGQALVDIHGQSEHLSLLRPARHVDFLDRYGGLLGQRAEVAASVTSLRAVRRELRALQSDERELARRMDLLRYQIDEIRAAGLQDGEEQDLVTERTRLQNAERIMSLADSAYEALYGGSEGQSGTELLGSVAASLAHLSQLDTSVSDMAAAAEGLGYQAEELARSLRSYRDGLDLDPARLEQVEERLALIHGLKRKYGSTVAEVLSYLTRAEEELEAAGSRDVRAAELSLKESSLAIQAGAQAAALSISRRGAADRLASAIEAEMAGLNMPKVRFSVDLGRRPDPDGILAPGEQVPVALGQTGIDEVEFMISPNPGEPLKPLAKIASGGETSRLMLAMKSILSEADSTPTLIFDEIDQGVGGRSGQVVGQKLWSLARRHQVICVTHLPQIAVFGDAHFNIAKLIEGERTVTRVRALDDSNRNLEIAEMLGGTGEAGRVAAREMLGETSAWKAARAA